jgi:hypothetical protein
VRLIETGVLMLGILPRRQYLFSPNVSFLIKWFPERYHAIFLILFFYGLLAATTLAPVSSIDSIPNTKEYMASLAAIIQAKMALTAGQFPLRTMPLEYSGWLYPFYQFYSPSTFTFAGLIYKWVTPANPIIALEFTLWIGLTLGGIYMYRLAFWFVKSMPAAFLAGVIYLSAPYMIIIVNRLGNLNEVVALGLLPAVVFYSLARFYSPDKNSILLKASISWYLLITTHIVTFVYTLLFVGVLVALITLKNPRHKRNLMRVAIAVFLGCLLAMWYLAPIAALEKFFVIGATYNDASYISKFHPSLSHLLFSAASYTTNVKNSIDALHPAVGLPILFSAFLCIYALYNRMRSGIRRADYWMPFLLILFCGAFFMAWSPINFWKWLPSFLLVGQFSWRLLGEVCWLGALLSAWTICWLFKNNLDLRHIIIGTFLILISTTAWYPLSEDSNINLAHFLKNPIMNYNRNAYKINFLNYPKFVGRIDSSLLDSETLKVGGNYLITNPMLQFAANPVIEMKSQIPTSYANRQLHLAAYADDNEIARQDLTPGELAWKIDLRDVKNVFKGPAPLRMKFVLLDKNDKVIMEDVPLDNIILTGFINPQEIMRVPQVQPYCQQDGNSSSCAVFVPAGVNFLVLPALYYPKLLRVTLDGKITAYQSIMYEGSLMAGIIPNAGANNKIEIKFTGLVWANWVSWFAWGLVAVLMLQSFILYLLSMKKARVLRLQMASG